ncbi:MAG: hypothetical protein WCI59_11845 [Betaproteobacteria bacterium]
MQRLLCLALVMASLTGCTAVAEFVYDDALERQRRACDRLLDVAAYRTCFEKVREAERQAQAVRKGS